MNLVPRPRDFTEFRKLQRATFLTKADYTDVPSESFLERSVIESIIQHHLRQKPARIRRLKRSTLHFVYRVTMKEDSVIVRLNALSDRYKEVSFFTEQWIHNVLCSRNLPSLTIPIVDITRTIAPFDYEIMEDAGDSSFFDLSKKDALKSLHFRQAGKYIASVHALETKGWGPIDAGKIFQEKISGVFNTWRSYLSKNFDRHLSILVKEKLISLQENKQYKEIFSSYSFPSSPSRLLHGDVANHNIFPHKRGVVFIDWEDALAGDPVYDIAYWGTGAFDNKDWFTEFFAGYTSIRSLPADFEMRYWLYFLRISIAKAVVRLREGKDTPSLRSFSARRIRKALSYFSSL